MVKKVFCSRQDQQFNSIFSEALKYAGKRVVIAPTEEIKKEFLSFISRRCGKGRVFSDFNFSIVVQSAALKLSNEGFVGIIALSSKDEDSYIVKEAASLNIPCLLAIPTSMTQDLWAFAPKKEAPDWPKGDRELQDQEIADIFIDTFSIAEKEIDIICPWINQSVVNEYLLSLIDLALGKGVKIKIVYGIGTESDDARSQTSEDTVEMMKNRFAEYGTLEFLKDNTHEKILLCDDKYMMIGSYNFLSFVGDYSREGVRRETVAYSVDKVKISQSRQIHFTW